VPALIVLDDDVAITVARVARDWGPGGMGHEPSMENFVLTFERNRWLDMGLLQPWCVVTLNLCPQIRQTSAFAVTRVWSVNESRGEVMASTATGESWSVSIATRSGLYDDRSPGRVNGRCQARCSWTRISTV
jgi:hypothetical protein